MYGKRSHKDLYPEDLQGRAKIDQKLYFYTPIKMDYVICYTYAMTLMVRIQ
jgi:hypothetical protein